MKQSTSKAKAVSEPMPTELQKLQDKVTSVQKAVEKQWAAYEKSESALQDALQKDQNKLAVLELQSAAKIAKLTYKIKKTELKLAKATFKLTQKDLKKAAKESAAQDNKKASKKH